MNRLLVLSIIAFCCISCSSEDDRPDSHTEGTFLSFNISGIAERNNIIKIANTSINRKNDGAFSESKNEQMVSLGDFDVLTNIENSQDFQNNNLTKSASIDYTASNPTTANKPMITGTKYRLLIYDATSNTLVKDVDATVGTNPTIQVESGKQYNWYAISTNSNISPTVNPTTGIVSGNSLANKDILYNHGTVDTQYGENNLDIIFKHHNYSIEVDLDTRGMFGTINNSTSLEIGTGTDSNFSSVIKTGDLNLFTGLYSNLQDAPALLAANMVDKTGSGGAIGATKVATFHSVSTTTIPENTLKVKLNKLDLTTDNNTTISFSNSIVPYNNNLIIPILGNKYNITAKLIESGIKVKGLLWARTNLTYNSSQEDKYRLRVNNEYSDPTPQADYWNWMAATPTGSSSDSIDPCSKIYPENTWRMPTSSEFNSLGNPDKKNENYGLLFGAVFSAVWNLDTGNSVNTSYPEKSQNLFIPLYGYRTASGSINDSPVGLVLGVLGSGSAYYWTSTARSTTNADYYYIKYSRILILVGWSDYEIRNDVKTEGRSVRCVRTIATPNT
ncbi:TPA: hypothetical protein ACGZ99_003424 [Elizabethkingia anophelis]